MKTIFLDIDGVLNKISPEYHTPHKGVDGMLTMVEPELVNRLNLIVDRTGAELVLSSSWRHLKDWREVMKASGIVKKFLDRTPRYVSASKHGTIECELIRGHNIKDWLDEHEVEDYVILDDEADFLLAQVSHLFRTKTADGLTQEIADNVEKYLSP